VKLFNEKRSDLEEQQLHLNIGLQKIRETVEQVEELQRSLSIKRNELEEKNNLANAKLKQMVIMAVLYRFSIAHISLPHSVQFADVHCRRLDSNLASLDAVTSTFHFYSR